MRGPGRTRTAALAGAATLVAALIAWQLSAVLLLLLWGGLLAYLLSPLVVRLERTGMGRVAAIVVVFLLIGSLLALAVGAGVPVAVREGGRLLRLLPPHLHRAAAQLAAVESELLRALPPRLADAARRSLAGYEAGLARAAAAGLQHLLRAAPGLISLILGPLVAFYLLKDGNRILRALLYIWPPADELALRDLLWRLDRTVGGFLRGQVLVAAAVGVLAGLVAVAFHLGFGVLIGVVAGVTEVVPYVGPVLGAIPAVAVASLHGATTVLWVVLAFVAIHQIEGGILSPLIVGQEMGLSPLAVLLALFVGGEVGGILGLLLAVPAAGAAAITLRWLFERWVEPGRWLVTRRP